MVVRAKRDGEIVYVDAAKIVIRGKGGDETHKLRKFEGLNERTCINQTPIVKLGDRVEKGVVIADGAATKEGVLALGRNLTVAFMPWDGYNYEDAILLSETLVKDDVYTSIHIDEFEIEIADEDLDSVAFGRLQTGVIANVAEAVLAVKKLRVLRRTPQRPSRSLVNGDPLLAQFHRVESVLDALLDRHIARDHGDRL